MTEAALLAGLCSHPDDDTPRLVYADWLDENGRPDEAEMIRLQCRLAANGPLDPDYAELRMREAELALWLAAHRPGPQLRLRGGLNLAGAAAWWSSSRRGFPRSIELRGAGLARGTFAKRAGAALGKLFARVPTRWLTVSEVTPAQFADLLREPILERLERLSVAAAPNSDDQADEFARIAAEAPTLRTLRGLWFGIPLGEAGIAALARAPFSRLDAFGVASDRITGADMRTLTSAEWFRHLRELDFDEGFGDDALAALAASEPLPHLHSLAMKRSTPAVAAWVEFALSRSFPRLARLDLTGTDLSRGRMAALAGATGFALRELTLRGCAIGSDGASALARAAWANSLTRLELQANLLSRRGIKSIAASPRLANLRHLALDVNSFDTSGLEQFSRTTSLRSLRSLSMASAGDFTADEIRYPRAAAARVLAELRMPELRELDLSHTDVFVAGAQDLADNPALANLTRLRLVDCELGDEGAAVLLRAPAMRHHVELDLRHNDIGAAAAALLDRAAFPRLSRCRLDGNPLTPALMKSFERRVEIAYDGKPT